MKEQFIFQRYEIKYMLTKQQKIQLLCAMQDYMDPDPHGQSTICNIYYDTPDYYLIRHSMEHPVYKEKFRIRSYGCASPDTPVFIELKKKYRSVVYKRRIQLPDHDAESCMKRNHAFPGDSQIHHEISYFRKFYEALEPAVALFYDREAFYSKTDPNFRITFDENIRYRTEDFSLQSPASGEQLLPPGMVLMEVKTAGALPLWMTHLLTAQNLQKTSFSKYGTAYQNMQSQGGHQ